VVVGVLANEGGDLAMTVDSLWVFTSGLVDHPEAIPPTMHIGEAFEEIPRGARGFVELAGTEEVDRSVGGASSSWASSSTSASMAALASRKLARRAAGR
jgi:hypothetical protein